MHALGIAALLCIAVGVTACGGSETTTVIKEAPTPPPETVERTTTVQAPPASPTVDNYTICNQGKPRGNIVVVLAQKYGC